MKSNFTATDGKIVSIDENIIKEQLNELVRTSVEEMLNALLEAEAKVLCNAERYERSEHRKGS